MNFLEKLDFLMNKYGLNKRTLSQKSGIPYTTIDAWYKKGYEGLKLTTLRKLNDFFNTTLDYWILDEVTDPNYGKSSGFKVEFDEMEHIKKYRELDPYGQETVNMIMDRELNRTKQLAEFANRSPAASLRIYTYMHKIAAAGNGIILMIYRLIQLKLHIRRAPILSSALAVIPWNRHIVMVIWFMWKKVKLSTLGM